jgi:hypothetical protein
MQSLRDAVHRIPHPHASSQSRTSLTSEKKQKSEAPNRSSINDEDAISLKVPNLPSRSSMYYSSTCIRRGLVVRISAFHAGGPGSIPGVGILFFVLSVFLCLYIQPVYSFFFNVCFLRSKAERVRLNTRQLYVYTLQRFLYQCEYTYYLLL